MAGAALSSGNCLWSVVFRCLQKDLSPKAVNMAGKCAGNVNETSGLWTYSAAKERRSTIPSTFLKVISIISLRQEIFLRPTLV